MKRKLSKLKAALLVAVGLVAIVQPAMAGRVDSAEAIKVAKWWLGQEIGGDWSQVPVAQQQALLDTLANPGIRAIWLEGTEFACGDLPVGKDALAWSVEFPGGGYVVVAGDDRIEPVLVFDAQKPFVWEGDRGTITRVVLSRMLSSWNQAIASKSLNQVLDDSTARWGALRTMVGAKAVPQADGEEYSGPVPMAVSVSLETASWSQGGYYNDTLQTHVGNNNSVPVGCTATMMAIFMRYFQWPNTGTGNNSYWDVCDGVNYWHSVTLGSTYYWSSMPVGNLTSANSHVANLMYQCGVMTGMNYEVGESGAWLSTAAMQSSFRYRGIITRTSSHEGPIQVSIKAGVPVMLSSSSHSMVCDGYRDTTAPYYHINAGHDGGGDGWYSMTTLPAGDTTVDRSYPYCTPNNWAYAQSGYSGTENGDLNTPYNTVGEGSAGVSTYGQLWLKTGTYSGTGNIGTYTKAMTIKSHGGSAVIQ